MRVRVRKKLDQSTLFEAIIPSFRQQQRAEGGGPVATITTLLNNDDVEYVLINVDATAVQSGYAFVTYGWGF